MRFPTTRFLPSTIKNKLFLAFILLILLPFSILNVYNFKKMEGVLRLKVSEQSQEELERMKRSFEEMMKTTFRTFTLLEQDPNISSMLIDPQKYDAYDTQANLENKFKAITSSIFLGSPSVYYTVLDAKGHYYTSYKPLEMLDYKHFTGQSWYRGLLENPQKFQWSLEKNYVHKDESTSPQFLSVSTTFKRSDGSVFAYVKVSIDYLDWFRSVTATTTSSQEYLLLDEKRQVVAQNASTPFDAGEWSALARHSFESGYDMNENYILNYCYIPMLDWYLIKQVPKDIVYAEIDKLKRSFFISFFAFTMAFIAITFLIAAKITQPLKQIQQKMQEMVRKNLKVRLPEDRYRGEFKQLTQTFNQMVGDMNDLIARLKSEERQKEAVHFQMLLSQTNPHFLLNTLNTIKWIALGKQDEEIAEICISLGKLLEASLNSEVDLIHLKEERELVESYIYIQSYRYKQSYTVHFEIEDSLQFALVPKLSLQPLVENSIQHGFAGMREHGEIWIRAYEDGGSLVVQVEDNGLGRRRAEQDKKPSQRRGGIGLSNLKQRLYLLFKDKAGLQVDDLSLGTQVQFCLPMLLSMPYGKE
ncbi:sensor histidine kinase [Paenibacillus sp. OAS669]|uniref:sensor histidine kinase n=1 Tax=Paenibacillus sp. OAS669 TaxID=2663821 RepID=UPI00178A3EB3|nr:sensor histidine kinase [Paenibacillus sp. OAS669]MBE1445121.1 sensor histidine kinase YesM [Paenibacillus sp. OAS669]